MGREGPSEVQEGSGGPPRSLVVVRKALGTLGGVGRASRKSLRGRECPWKTLRSREGSEGPSENLGGVGRGREGPSEIQEGLGSPRKSGRGREDPQWFGRGQEGTPGSLRGVGRAPGSL